MSDQDNTSGNKPMSVDEKRELLKDMDISYTSKRVGDVDEAGNIVKEQVANTVDEKRELLKDMEITYTSKRVGDVDEAGNIAKDRVAQTVEEKRELLDDMEITYTSKRVSDAVTDTGSIEQQLKSKADSEIASGIEKRASDKLGNTAGGAAGDAYTAVRNNASSQFVQAQQQAAKQRAEAAAQRKVGENTQRVANDVADKFGGTAGQTVKEGLDEAASAKTSDFLNPQHALASGKESNPTNMPSNNLAEVSPAAATIANPEKRTGNAATNLSGNTSAAQASANPSPTNASAAKQKAPIAINALNTLVIDNPARDIVLQDEQGQPLANIRYVIEAKGQEIEGTTDGSGKVEIGLPEGMKEVFINFWPDPEDDSEIFRIALELGALDDISSPKGVQQRLANMGVLEGNIDGDIGPITQTNLKALQHKNKLELSGAADDDTIAWLEANEGIA